MKTERDTDLNCSVENCGDCAKYKVFRIVSTPCNTMKGLEHIEGGEILNFRNDEKYPYMCDQHDQAREAESLGVKNPRRDVDYIEIGGERVLEAGQFIFQRKSNCPARDESSFTLHAPAYQLPNRRQRLN